MAEDKKYGCQTCQWWDRSEEDRDVGGRSECHGAPPTAILHNGERIYWPLTSASDWCAKHTPT